jgi:hypothetical protein
LECGSHACTATGALVPLGFLFYPVVGGPTECHLEAGGATVIPSGPTVPPPPPGPAAVGSPTMASGGQTTHRTKVGGPTATLGG